MEIYIDIGAEKVIAAERGGEKIAVEVKSFLGYSNITEFHVAVNLLITVLFYQMSNRREHCI